MRYCWKSEPYEPPGCSIKRQDSACYMTVRVHSVIFNRNTVEIYLPCAPSSIWEVGRGSDHWSYDRSFEYRLISKTGGIFWVTSTLGKEPQATSLLHEMTFTFIKLQWIVMFWSPHEWRAKEGPTRGCDWPSDLPTDGGLLLNGCYNFIYTHSIMCFKPKDVILFLITMAGLI